ncbi:nucleoside kinase [candidate division WOR-3 bacterium]|nr:nucleoside kinase [candidate division WOR-3 bacterium]
MNKPILDLYPDLKYPTTLARIDNQYSSLVDKAPLDGIIELLGIENTEGRRTYERTLVFLLDYTAKRKGVTLKIEHSYGDSLFGRFLKGSLELNQVKKEIRSLIEEDKKIERLMPTKLEAMHLLKKREDDLNILKHLYRSHIPIYKMDNFVAYFAGPLLPSTGFLSIFDLIALQDGFLVILPSRKDPFNLGKTEKMKKLFKTYRESEKLSEILKIWDISQLNEYILSGGISEIVKIAEAIHTEKITEICSKIINRNDRVKFILIAGPSSSGKTTFAKRLGVHLRVHGLEPEYISLDDYFLNRGETPVYKDSIPYFDTIEAIDVKLFRKHMSGLIEGKEVKRLRFNFKKGKKEWHGETLKIGQKTVLIIEGLHAFNPVLFKGMEQNNFKIYVSALTQLNINRVNRIPTRDLRLLRRIFRDTRFRGHSANDTLKQWDSVVEGEEQFVFPYQERADIMFNSSLVYELAVLRGFVETPLRSIETSSPYYCESLRLLNFLDHFLGITEDEIPPTSILREFIGGSTFYY